MCHAWLPRGRPGCLTGNNITKRSSFICISITCANQPTIHTFQLLHKPGGVFPAVCGGAGKSQTQSKVVPLSPCSHHLISLRASHLISCQTLHRVSRCMDPVINVHDISMKCTWRYWYLSSGLLCKGNECRMLRYRCSLPVTRSLVHRNLKREKKYLKSIGLQFAQCNK
jgi:hypothetical protein